VRIEPAGDACQHGSVDEHDQLHAKGADAERFSGNSPAAQRANGAAGTRVEQIVRGNRGQDHKAPNDIVDAAAVVEVIAGDIEGRDRRDAVMAMEQLEFAKQKIETEPPGDGAEREIVAREAYREQTQHQCGCARDGQCHRQCRPRRPAVAGRQHGRGERAKAAEGRLAERRQAADAGKHDQPDRDQRTEANVVEQRDPERGDAGE
jgi:hypothetical protein